MAGGQVGWTVLAVVAASVRSQQDSYGSPSTAVLTSSSPAFSSSGATFNSAPSFSSGSLPIASGSAFSSSNNAWPSSSSPTSQHNPVSVQAAPLSFTSTGASFGNSYSGSSSNIVPPPQGSTSNFEAFPSKSNIGSSSNVGSSRPKKASIPTGGIDFSQATRQPDGRMCVIKEASVETVTKDPILECKHKEVEKCHYTYTTYFQPAQEETCQENFEKVCQITFNQEAIKEKVTKCYRPVEKVCNGQGPEECRTVYESSCTTRYIEEGPGKFVGDTKCDKLPVKICGSGCVTEEGAEECHNKMIDTLVEVPQETCDLNPQKTCRLVTKLVPSLKPKQECTTVPQEVCSLKFTQPKRKQKPLRTEWCLDDEATDSLSDYSEPQPDYGGPRSGRRFGSSR